jgi:hypothetical protein
MDNKIKSLLDRFLLHRLPSWNDLPDIDLYMDQVIAFMRRYIGGVSEAADKILTPAMVNNYVKQKIMPAPVKKKYSREHLAYLTVICVLKQVLPIASVQEVMSNLLETYTVPELLNLFAAMYKERWDRAVDSMSNQLKSDEEKKSGRDKSHITQNILAYAVDSYSERVIAEQLLAIVSNTDDTASAVVDKPIQKIK